MTQRGASLVELLVTIAVFSIVFLIMSSVYMGSLKSLDDQRLMSEVNEEAFDLSQLIAGELRQIGAGLPLTQSNFQPSGSGLGDAPLSVLLTSTNDAITFRYNAKGGDTVLVGDYAPSPSDLTFAVHDASYFQENDLLYLSNLPSRGEEGFFGQISRVSGAIATVHSGYIASAGALFPSGSFVSRIREVTITSQPSFGGVSRSEGASTVSLSTNGQLSIEYFDSNGSSLSLPLTASDVQSQLSSLEIIVVVRTSRQLHDGNFYYGSARQRVALKNLLMARYQ